MMTEADGREASRPYEKIGIMTPGPPPYGPIEYKISAM